MKLTVLSDICEISSGGTPSRSNLSYYQGEIPWAKISDIENAKEGVIFDTEEKISEEGLKSIRNKIFPKGTLLFAMYGSIGKVAIAGRALSTNQAILGIRPKDTSLIDMKYLKIWFERNKQKLVNQGRGVALQNLSATIIRNLEIPLPPIYDQIRIATVLSKAEALIAKRKESIQILDELLKSTFMDMFGDPAKNVKGWEKKVFEGVAKGFRNGQSPVNTGKLKEKVYTLSAITGGCFKGNEYKISTFDFINDSSFVRNDDFLICRGNGNIKLVGRSAIVSGVDDKIVFPDTIICANIDITKVNKKFIEAMWKLPFIRGQIEQFARTTNGTYKINQQALKKIIIIIPPIALQNQFAAIVKKVESIKAKYQAGLTELENLYGSLSQRAFRGELDLSRVPVNAEVRVEKVEAELQAYAHEVEVINKLSRDELKKVIKNQLDQPFNFEKLWNVLQEKQFEEPAEYEVVKQMLFELLEADKPPLSQEFDDRTKDADGKPIREIVLRANI